MVRGNDNESSSIPQTDGDQEPAPRADFAQSCTNITQCQRFVGLANQGATCYMNSLLQSLFMTKSFRREIYRWFYDPEKEVEQKDCITFQLQALFGKLQLLQQTERTYIETTDLTKSFGWDLQEGFQQHDVQEFCRVLFDAIEKSCQDTEQANIINKLYQGTLQDYVQCLECQSESQREDKYLDISLTVRNDIDKIYNKSVQEALDNYINPEKLEGENKYHCERCNKKVDALKGLKFLSFPPILCLQLKRFDLDYQTLMRKKLNDYVSFPQILNMNSYLPKIIQLRKNESLNKSSKISQYQYLKQDLEAQQENDPASPEHPFNTEEQKEEANKIQNDFLKLKEESKNRPGYHVTISQPPQPKKTKEEIRREKDQTIEKYLQEGPNVYELFSIMIHSGSALGGHYYAYIKDFEIDSWYNFNDSFVSQIEETEIYKAYGNTQESQNCWGGSNAYLLMYRKVGYEVSESIDNSMVPPHVRDLLEQDRKKKMQEEEERQERRNNIEVKVYYNENYQIISTKLTNTLLELKQAALQKFQLDQTIKEHNCRLREYSVHYEMMQETFEDEERLLEYHRFYDFKPIALEVKEENENFEPYRQWEIHFKVQV